MEYIFISPSCLGFRMYALLNVHNTSYEKNEIKRDCPYNCPFIGTLIDIYDYLKLCKNLMYYIYECEITLKDDSKYIVVSLGDIDVIMIHESNPDVAINKFKRRMKRLQDIIKGNNYRLFFILTNDDFNKNYKIVNEILSYEFKKSHYIILAGPANIQIKSKLNENNFYFIPKKIPKPGDNNGTSQIVYAKQIISFIRKKSLL